MQYRYHCGLTCCTQTPQKMWVNVTENVSSAWYLLYMETLISSRFPACTRFTYLETNSRFSSFLRGNWENSLGVIYRTDHLAWKNRNYGKLHWFFVVAKNKQTKNNFDEISGLLSAKNKTCFMANAHKLRSISKT